MSRPLSSDSDVRKIGGVRSRASQLERRPAIGGGASVGAWQIPTLINSWVNAGAPFDDIAYRTGPSGLEFKGDITGGASGTIAFYMLAAWWPLKDLSTITDVITLTTPGAAQIYVYAVNGAVKVTSII